MEATKRNFWGYRNEMDEEYNFFWKTMELCDWEQEGNDEKVLEPVINIFRSRITRLFSSLKI